MGVGKNFFELGFGKGFEAPLDPKNAHTSENFCSESELCYPKVLIWLGWAGLKKVG